MRFLKYSPCLRPEPTQVFLLYMTLTLLLFLFERENMGREERKEGRERESISRVSRWAPPAPAARDARTAGKRLHAAWPGGVGSRSWASHSLSPRSATSSHSCCRLGRRVHSLFGRLNSQLSIASNVSIDRLPWPYTGLILCLTVGHKISFIVFFCLFVCVLGFSHQVLALGERHKEGR